MNGASRGAGLIVARVLVGLGLLVATLWVLQPFLVPAAWAAITAYVTWPRVRAAARVDPSARRSPRRSSRSRSR